MSALWHSYRGGPRPVQRDRYIEVTLRDGRTIVDLADHFRWQDHCYCPADIMAWRLHEPVVQPQPLVASQSRRGSLIEACINVLIGYGINFTANLLIFPLFGWHITLAQNLALGVIFTGISVARSYLIRRYFNARLTALARRLAGASA